MSAADSRRTPGAPDGAPSTGPAAGPDASTAIAAPGEANVESRPTARNLLESFADARSNELLLSSSDESDSDSDDSGDAGDVMVKDLSMLKGTLARMGESKMGMVYENHDGTIRFMLRLDPEGSSGHFDLFELCVVADKNDDACDRVREALVLDYDGWEAEDDPDSTYVMDSWEIRRGKPSREILAKMRDTINSSTRYSICPCSKYLIKDGLDKKACFHCHVTATKDSFREISCPICFDDGLLMHMITTSCCKKQVHRECLRTWGIRSKTDKCPMCRQPCQMPPPRQPRSPAAEMSIEIDMSELEGAVSRAIRSLGTLDAAR